MSNKFLANLKSLGLKAKENLVPILAIVIPGLVVVGSVTAIHDSKKLSKLEKDHNELVSVFNNNVDKHNSFVDWTHEEVEKLTRQNNELLERALRETEGKAS